MKKLLCVFLVLLSAAFITSCQKEGPAERAGERVDRATEDAADAMEDAADDVEDAVDSSH